MIAYFTKSLISWLIQHDAINEHDKELYEYAVYSILLTISPIFFSIVIGWILGLLKESIIMVLPFTIIRKFSGGYHAGNINYCLVGSCCILAFCIKITTIIKSGLGLSIITLCAIISLCINSPIEHENHTLDINEKQVYAKLARYITLSFGIISVILCKLQRNEYAICISIGLILTAALQIPCLLQKRYTKKKPL